jgi:ubiquinone/menaquinone biosynthesis C-methylase UbiE
MTRYVLIHYVDKYLIWRARDRNAVIDLPSHTVEQNRSLWDNYDWSDRGEEWTRDAARPRQWKNDLLEKMMFRYFKPNSVILEIGPGAGRWTEYLLKIAKRLILVDITPKCIEMCRERFSGHSNIEFHLIKDNIDFLPDNSVDFVWSYDVFVHINPSDTDRYVQNIRRILKPRGIAIIHHSTSEYDTEENAVKGFRSRMTAEKFTEVVFTNGMYMLEQNRDLVHKNGDIISVFAT